MKRIIKKKAAEFLICVWCACVYMLAYVCVCVWVGMRRDVERRETRDCDREQKKQQPSENSENAEPRLRLYLLFHKHAHTHTRILLSFKETST